MREQRGRGFLCDGESLLLVRPLMPYPPPALNPIPLTRPNLHREAGEGGALGTP